MVSLFRGEYYGDVEESDAAGSARMTGTESYPCLLMLSQEISVRVAAHRVLRSHEGK